MAHIRKHISIALPTKCCLNSPPDHYHIKMLCLSCPSCHTFRYCSQTLARGKLPLTAQECSSSSEAETEGSKDPSTGSSQFTPLSSLKFSHSFSFFSHSPPPSLPFPFLSLPKCVSTCFSKSQLGSKQPSCMFLHSHTPRQVHSPPSLSRPQTHKGLPIL